MKIERISENQVKFVLNANDLSERGIRMTELSYGNEKTQELFRDMMEAAVEECDFIAEPDTPLIIEAIPTSADSISIIVTKTNPEQAAERTGNLLDNLRGMRRRLEEETRRGAEAQASIETYDAVFSFEGFDDCAALADRLYGQFFGQNSLYLYDKVYYLVLDTRGLMPRARQELDFVLMEYARKVSSAHLSKEFLEEHGDVIMAENALAGLWEYQNS